MEHANIFVTSHPRIGPVLANEMERLGFVINKTTNSGVYSTGTFTDAMRMNLYLRTANRVLLHLQNFNAEVAEELYEQALKYPWEDILQPDGYYSVQSSVKNDSIKDNRFANLKLKDAIADRMKSKTGQRPNSGPLFDKSVIFLFWRDSEVTIYYDTSGETISRRSYRKNPYKAPMNEALAAAAVQSTSWDSLKPFINPMCGSGTVAIEAALMSMNKAPGISRYNFSFMHHRQFNSMTYRMLRNEAIVTEKKKPMARIIASDLNLNAVKAARENAREAGVNNYIDFKVCDFRETHIPEQNGVIFLNPEYGLRLGDEEKLRDLYAAIGDFFKKKCIGLDGYVFSGNANLSKFVGLKTSRRTEFYSGKIDCRLLEYTLYEGSRKEHG